MVSSIKRKESVGANGRSPLRYSGPFSGGKHQFMLKGKKKIRVPNPHGSGDVHISLVKEILRQAGISSEEWDKA